MSLSNGPPTSEFNSKADDALPKTDFCAFLAKKFDRGTALKVLESFQKMNLPPPQKQEEFFVGTEGCLVLLNRYGLVLRIEIADLEESKCAADRINDSGWIIKPIASLNAGKAMIEIIPGSLFEKDEKTKWFLQDQLQNQGINFWDNFTDNIGRLPIQTPSFPEGVPVVIDRLAVVRLSRNVEPVREELKALAEEAADAQEKLYAPLRQVFENAWPDAQKMKKFWELCEQRTQEGKLVLGWAAAKSGDDFKSVDAAKAASHYDVRLKSNIAAVTPSKTFTQWLKGL
jgi:hypothetical protein